MKIVVGLGNPGAEYAHSRHNAGFMVLDRFAEQHTIRFNLKRANSVVGRGRIDGVELVLAKPRTFMNLSGKAVQGLLMAYGLKPRNLLVVYDDFDLPLGTIRLRQRGTAGTHNGVRSIVDYLKTDEFPRLRLGIGAAETESARDYVLGAFDADSRAVFEMTISRAAEAIETLLREGLDVAMNRFNG